MEIGDVFCPRSRSEWRDWLAENHLVKKEIWLRLFRKGSGQQGISYDDLVEECLCFGWIDGTVKSFDAVSRVQRITPRRKRGSYLSELNRQRIWKMQRLGCMFESGIAPIADQIGSPDDSFTLPDWVATALREDPAAWEHFQRFPRLYQRLKIGWIAELKGNRPEETAKRLAYFIKMTAQGKRYGTEPLADWEC